MKKVINALVAGSILAGGCVEVHKAPVSEDYSAVAAKELIDISARTRDDLMNCDALKKRIETQTVRFLDKIPEGKFDSVTLSDKRTRASMIIEEIDDQISSIIVEFEPLNEKDSKGLFVGKIEIECKK